MHISPRITFQSASTGERQRARIPRRLHDSLSAYARLRIHGSIGTRAIGGDYTVARYISEDC